MTMSLKILFVAYVLFELLLPMGSAGLVAAHPPQNTIVPTWLLRFNRLTLFFVALPAYAVYGWLIVKEHFPDTTREALRLFIPLVFSLLTSLWWWPKTGGVDLFLFEGLPLFLGLNLLFFCGLVGIVVRKNRDTMDAAVVSLLLVLTLFLFGPALVLSVQGWELSRSGGLAETLLSETQYILAVILTAWSNLPILRKLYRAGEL